MNFMELKDQFLAIHPDYNNDLSNFLTYMQMVRGVILPGQQDLMVGSMNTELVVESLKYFVDTGKIQKKSVASKYFVAIGQLFEYVLNNSRYPNDSFLHELANPATRDKSYVGKTNIFVNRYEKLKSKEVHETFPTSLVKELLVWSDSTIGNILLRDEMINDADFKRIAASLCLKLMIFTGITYRVARSLEFDKLVPTQNTLEINDFRIRLPLVLSTQFQLYAVYHSKFVHSEFLFANADGSQWGEATSDSGIPNYMKIVIQQTNLTGVVKYGILHLIKSGINDSVIMKLTGASRDILKSCLDEAQNRDPGWEEYINSRIVTTELYYEL